MKRKRKNTVDKLPSKRLRVDVNSNTKRTWSLLQQYYPDVLTLRSYLARKVTKKRKRNILHFGFNDDGSLDPNADPLVSRLLDETVIGVSKPWNAMWSRSTELELSVFTQQLSTSTTTVSPTQGRFQQSEIVDFSVWLLFRNCLGAQRPSNILSHGFQRSVERTDINPDLEPVPGIPGIYSNGRNHNVKKLKDHSWSALPALIGKGVESILSELFLSCGIFQGFADSSNLVQICGVALSDLKVLTAYNSARDVLQPDKGNAGISSIGQTAEPRRGHSEIRFVRHRMLYARPNISAKGQVHFNLPYVHLLNRSQLGDDQQRAISLLRYIFPKQFGYHNVFTSKVDRKDTAQAFKDYTLRDQEIARATLRWQQRKFSDLDQSGEKQPPIPRRLRDVPLQLARILCSRHSKCSYRTLLEAYCPRQPNGYDKLNDAIALASDHSQVSAFCRACIRKVFPGALWGFGTAGQRNLRTILDNVDRFIRLRRYETLSLHDILQDIELASIQWLEFPTTAHHSKLSSTDFFKRQELISELLYYVFDSYLIPLVRGHFYVTESGVQRNQLFYYRHDVWKSICEPALVNLRETMLERCDSNAIKRTLTTRTLGVSQVRLLPKEQGMRPIINLRRRVQKLQRGTLVLGRSTNSLLTPAFSALNYEKSRQPGMLGSALFSVDDIYPRIRKFRCLLKDRGFDGQQLFFAKVDVKACFDTIPQKQLMQLVKNIFQTDSYQIVKYSRAKLIGGHSNENPQFGATPSWKFMTKAVANDSTFKIDSEIEADTKDGRKGGIYVDAGMLKSDRRSNIIKLLEEHVESNLIQLGSRFYRQKNGIPQGSIVSSLLCSLFYAEMEREELSFIDEGHSLLLRLIDDFLVITPKREVAEQFMRTMHAGLPNFGVEVKAEKSRTNFDLIINNVEIQRLPLSTDFPYCGNAINTTTLDLSKDLGRRQKSNIADSISVEYSKLPGQTFYRKLLTLLKLQMRNMLLSTSYNSLSTVLSNLHHSFIEVALKCYYYVRTLPARKQPSGRLVIKAVDDLVKLACMLMRQPRRGGEHSQQYECSVSHSQARWLACTAFRSVFQRRQARYRELLAWLEGQLSLPALRSQRCELQAVVERNLDPRA